MDNVEFTPRIWNVDMATGVMIIMIRTDRVNLPAVSINPDILEDNTECYLVYRNHSATKQMPSNTFQEYVTYDKDNTFTEDSPKPSGAIGCGIFHKGMVAGLLGEDGVFIPSQVIKDIIEGKSLE